MKKKSNRKKDFNPEIHEKAKRYGITCVVCGKDKMVAFKPIGIIPAICDDCKEELEAKRWLYANYDGIESTKKLSCKSCNKSFYAPNETFLFCFECYNNFSKIIQAKERNKIFFKCDNCGAEDFVSKRIYDNQKEHLCKECYRKKVRRDRLDKVKKK